MIKCDGSYLLKLQGRKRKLIKVNPRNHVTGKKSHESDSAILLKDKVIQNELVIIADYFNK